MSKLLMEEHPLIVIPQLAKKTGLNEAIVLQQIHYWTEINRKANKNLYDGFYWTFNSYDQWNEQFPFWHVNTIKKTITNLEKAGLVVVGNYNKLKIDRTKWYRVDYEVLETLEKSPLYNICTTNRQKWYDHRTKIVRPLPETNPETTTKTTHNGALSDESCTIPFPPEIMDAVNYYFRCYLFKFKKDHPKIKYYQLNRVMQEIQYFTNENGLDYDGLTDMIDQHFKRNMATDYNINHFATDGVLQNLMYEVAY